MAKSVRATRSLLAGGAVGASLFILVFLIDGATRPGYDPAYHPVSALSLGARGWIQIINFTVTGSLMLAYAVGLRRALFPGRAARWGPWLVGTFGVGLILSGVFVMDPMRGYPPGTPVGADPVGTWHHTLHDLAGVVVFVSLPLASLVLARRFTAPPSRPGWAAYCLATGVLGLALLVAFGTMWEADHAYQGLVQRILIVTGWLWLALLALRLRADLRTDRVAAGPELT